MMAAAPSGSSQAETGPTKSEAGKRRKKMVVDSDEEDADAEAMEVETTGKASKPAEEQAKPKLLWEDPKKKKQRLKREAKEREKAAKAAEKAKKDEEKDAERAAKKREKDEAKAAKDAERAAKKATKEADKAEKDAEDEDEAAAANGDDDNDNEAAEQADAETPDGGLEDSAAEDGDVMEEDEGEGLAEAAGDNADQADVNDDDDDDDAEEEEEEEEDEDDADGAAEDDEAAEEEEEEQRGQAAADEASAEAAAPKLLWEDPKKKKQRLKREAKEREKAAKAAEVAAKKAEIAAKKAAKAADKPAKAPKKPPTAKKLFVSDKRAEVKEANADADAKEITAILEARWSELSDEDRAEYEAKAAELKEEYVKAKGDDADPESPASEGGSRKRKAKKAKDPNAPKKALSAYMIFTKEVRAEVKEANPGVPFGELNKLLAARWGDLSDEDKAPYEAKAAEAKEKYAEEAAAYELANPTVTRPVPPKRYLGAYMLFANDMRDSVKEANPGTSFGGQGKIIGAMWKELTAEAKAPYEARAAAGKEEWTKAMEEFAEVEKAFLAEHPEFADCSGEADDDKATPSKPAKKAKRDPNAPKKPPSPYSLFASSKRAEVKAENDGATSKETQAILKQLWKDLSDEDRAPFETLHAEAKEQYEEELKAYEAASADGDNDDAEAGMDVDDDAGAAAAAADDEPAADAAEGKDVETAEGDGDDNGDNNDDDDDDDDLPPATQVAEEPSQPAAKANASKKKTRKIPSKKSKGSAAKPKATSGPPSAGKSSKVNPQASDGPVRTLFDFFGGGGKKKAAKVAKEASPPPAEAKAEEVEAADADMAEDEAPEADAPAAASDEGGAADMEVEAPAAEAEEATEPAAAAKVSPAKKTSPAKKMSPAQAAKASKAPAKSEAGSAAAAASGECTPLDKYNPGKTKYDPVADACWVRGQDVPYRALATTLALIEDASGRLDKIAILRNFLQSVIVLTPRDLAKCIMLSSNTLAPAFKGVELGIGDSILMKVVSATTGRELSKLREAMKTECDGDLGLIAERSSGSQKKLMFALAKPKAPQTVSKVFEKLTEVANIQGGSSQDKKGKIIQSMVSNASPVETRFIIRACSGKLRIGMAVGSVMPAVAHAVAYNDPLQAFPPKVTGRRKGESEEVFKTRMADTLSKVKQAFCEMPDWNKLADIICKYPIDELKDHVYISPGMPVTPMLAKPSNGVDDILARCDGSRFACEWKYDGERAQVHMTAEGKVEIYSRNSENNTGKYPDIVLRMPELVKEGIESFIIDCEAVAYDIEKDTILPFQQLSTRKKKDADTEDLKGPAVCLYAFDLLYLNGESYLKHPFEARRDLLRESFTAEKGKLHFATSHVTDDSDEIAQLLDRSIEENCEGLMVKQLDTTYEIAARSHSWLKLKKDYLDGVGDTLDLTVVGAWHGKGKRSGTYGAFLLACYDPDSEEYQVITKIGTGFSDEDLKQHYATLKEHVIDGPKGYYQIADENLPEVWFAPAQVWEVKVADLSISPKYRAAAGRVDPEKGISLRFPRFMRVRDDKKPEASTSSEQVAEMYLNQAVVKNAKGGAGGAGPADDDDFW